MRELVTACGLRSTNAIFNHIRRLEELGILRFEYERARSITLRFKLEPD
jgi:hypothetical protein